MTTIKERRKKKRVQYHFGLRGVFFSSVLTMKKQLLASTMKTNKIQATLEENKYGKK